ncbi:hypothetical protein J41TS12_49310 [Paenibacillus antibioticophila]|uniref:M23ase beta-sheet core domain-containing protein n=2 Tax=Paenibacillus antibioticophila TaxID=1274374 RepID=A0A919Y115_9BACL|nr:hypothetical protein J41TS12_49310 [Paenibacillus antibioticophila]
MVLPNKYLWTIDRRNFWRILGFQEDQMKLNLRPKNKKYTVLIVPEGTSPVFRFNMRSFSMITLAAILLVMLGMLMMLMIMNRQHTGRIVSLKAELSTSTNRLESTVANKEQAIDELLTELMDLSEKSKTIESKMAELEQLEADMKAITSGGRKSSGTGNILTDSDKSMEHADTEGGVGGEAIPLSDEEVSMLIEETKLSISSSLEEMPELQSRMEQTKTNLKKYKEMMTILPTYWPTESVRITSTFGTRRDPFNGTLTSHNGIDIGGPSGDPVYAAAHGTVTDTGYSSARGNYITVSHPSGVKTNYMHLKEISVSKGDAVKQGDTIGLLGSTGRSTGPHLHFEVIKQGTPVDPINYLTIPGEDE